VFTLSLNICYLHKGPALCPVFSVWKRNLRRACRSRGSAIKRRDFSRRYSRHRDSSRDAEIDCCEIEERDFAVTKSPKFIARPPLFVYTTTRRAVILSAWSAERRSKFSAAPSSHVSKYHRSEIRPSARARARASEIQVVCFIRWRNSHARAAN